MSWKRHGPFILFVVLLPTSLSAQGDHYDSGGKLIAVIGCVAVILIGLFLFLFYLERRIKKVEDDLNVPR